MEVYIAIKSNHEAKRKEKVTIEYWGKHMESFL